MQSVVRGLVKYRPHSCLFHTLQVSVRRPPLHCVLSFLRNPPVRHRLLLTRNPRRFTAKHEQDKVPQSYELIYNNNMNSYYFYSQCVIYAVLVPTTVCLLYLMFKHRHDLKGRIEKEELDHPYFIAVAGLVFSVGMLTFTNTVCRRGVVRMYQNPQTKSFYAVLQRWNMVKQSIKFEQEDCVPITKPSAAGKFSLSGNVQIKGHNVLIRDTDFRSPIYYNELMGWELATKERAARHSDDVFDLYQKYGRKQD